MFTFGNKSISSGAASTSSMPRFQQQGVGDNSNTVNNSERAATKNSLINKTANFFQGTDGWDELGSSLGQILPGIGQHIATLSFLSVLTPAVYLGVKGMATEYEEAHASIDMAKQAKQKLINKIIDVFNLKIDPDIFAKGATSFRNFVQTLEKHQRSNPADFEKKAKLLTEYSDALKHESATKIGYDAAPFGVYAMSGMFGGMISAATTSSVEIAHAASPATQGLELAAAIGEAVTSGIFIPAQVAMVAYSLMKYHQGQSEKAIKQFDKQQVSEFKEHEPSALSDPFYNAIQDNLDRQINYIHREKVLYGAGLAASEAGMIAGTALGFTPAAPVGVGVLAPAAASTIAFAGLRIHTAEQKGKFTGHPHDHEHNGSASVAIKQSTQHQWRRFKNLFRSQENQSAIPSLTQVKPDDSCIHNYSSYQMSAYDQDKKTIEEQFSDATKRLADYKKASLLVESIETRKLFEKMASTGRKSFFKGTTLQKDVLTKVSDAPEFTNANSCLSINNLPTQERHKLIANIDQSKRSLLEKDKEVQYLQGLALNILLDKPSVIFDSDIGDSILKVYNDALKKAGKAEQTKERVLDSRHNALFKQHLQDDTIFNAVKPLLYEVLILKHMSDRKFNRMINPKLKNIKNTSDKEDLFSSMMEKKEVLVDISKNLVRDKKAEAKRDRQAAIDQMIFVAKYRNMIRDAKTDIDPIDNVGAQRVENALVANNLFLPSQMNEREAIREQESGEESKTEIESPANNTQQAMPVFAAGFATLLATPTVQPDTSLGESHPLSASTNSNLDELSEHIQVKEPVVDVDEAKTPIRRIIDVDEVAAQLHGQRRIGKTEGDIRESRIARLRQHYHGDTTNQYAQFREDLNKNSERKSINRQIVTEGDARIARRERLKNQYAPISTSNDRATDSVFIKSNKFGNSVDV